MYTYNGVGTVTGDGLVFPVNSSIKNIRNGEVVSASCNGYYSLVSKEPEEGDWLELEVAGMRFLNKYDCISTRVHDIVTKVVDNAVIEFSKAGPFRYRFACGNNRSIAMIRSANSNAVSSFTGNVVNGYVISNGGELIITFASNGTFIVSYYVLDSDGYVMNSHDYTINVNDGVIVRDKVVNRVVSKSVYVERSGNLFGDVDNMNIDGVVNNVEMTGDIEFVDIDGDVINDVVSDMISDTVDGTNV